MKAESRKKLQFLKELAEMGFTKNEIAEFSDRQQLFEQAERFIKDEQEEKEYF
jgi:hypothetical protein